MIVPVGRFDQVLVKVERRVAEVEQKTLIAVRFVPMTEGVRWRKK
jgi:protein-L-isoaspartate O-methyltransferase